MATTSNPNPVILPSQVAFKSEDGKKYLCSIVQDDYYNYHKFQSGFEMEDIRVGYELFLMPNGYYRIKSHFYGKFWKRSPNWIWADADQNNNDPDTMFQCILLKDNVIALRNLGNDLFCGALTTEGKTDCLNANYPTTTRQTRLIVEERVIKREISILVYQLSKSEVYEKQVVVLAEETIQNESPHEKLKQSIKFSETTETTTSWNNSISVKFGLSVTFNVEAVPVIAEGGVRLSFDVGYEHQWGGTKKSSSTIETITEVVVPPLTNMKVSLLCSKAFCDVPFSYRQTDWLPDGTTVSVVKHDGTYTGNNAYEFKVRSAEVDEDGKELKLLKVLTPSVDFKLNNYW